MTKSIALLGLGAWGKNIFRNLYELSVLRFACDLNDEIIRDFQARFPKVEYSSSVENILGDPSIRAIVLATPAATHFHFAKKALEQGKDVFVEKPLALTVEQGEELVSIAGRNKAILMTGHILQYHPAIQKLNHLLADGAAGKVQYIYSNRLNIGKLRIEEDILWSFAPHDISVILSLLQEEPIVVSAFGGAYLNDGIHDTTITAMEFSNGVKAHVFVSWLHPFKEQKLIVVGSKSMIVFDDLADQKLLLYPHTVEWRNGKLPVANQADYQVIAVDQGEPLRRELEHFLQCVKDRKKPITDGEEGLKVLKVLALAQEALLAGKRVGGRKTQAPSYFVHSSAYVDDDVQIGNGTKVWHFSHILKSTRVGKDCVIGQNVMIGPNVSIGNRVKIQNNVSVYEGVELEDDVFCGPSMVFTNVINPRAFIERKHEFRRTLVKRGATLGANATIICGVTVGEYALVGAGAVVTKDVPAFAVVVGIPSRQTGWVCKCGTRLSRSKRKRIQCETCQSLYQRETDRLIFLDEQVG